MQPAGHTQFYTTLTDATVIDIPSHREDSSATKSLLASTGCQSNAVGTMPFAFGGADWPLSARILKRRSQPRSLSDTW